MILPFLKARLESWAVVRARMLHETEAFLEDGLRNPARYPRIPMIPVGNGSFRPEFAEMFWEQVLDEE